MYARIIRVQVPTENFDLTLAGTKERNVPMVTQFPGFKSMEQMRPMAEQLGVRFLSVENLEVFVHEEAR